MFPLSRSLSIAMALALPAIACAQQPADLDQVEVTATRTASAIADRLFPVRVIDSVPAPMSRNGWSQRRKIGRTASLVSM